MQTTTQKPDVTITRRIGTTIYTVSVHYSKTSAEDINDKIARLIKSDPAIRKSAS